MFKWRCGICNGISDCRALALRDGYVSFVCDRGHHQVGYGQMRFCADCGRDTIQMELLEWSRSRKPEYRIVGFVCCECGIEEKTSESADWRDDR